MPLSGIVHCLDFDQDEHGLLDLPPRNALNVMLAVTCNYSRFFVVHPNTFYRSRNGLYLCRICRALVMDPVIPWIDCLILLLLVQPVEFALYFGDSIRR